MEKFLMVFQVIISILLTVSILSQNRGTGLSATFGGSGGFFSSKRGAEKVLFNLSIVFAVLFVLNSLAFLFI
ncbi:preprotein translocase subunit SecG [Candidatus Peregrinibacteria bacterium CG10_big_fil_rev_8_21_14_0_10_36_19]|nr:MAG: preprotein translocase subunit SecG [Candidatus Peregrinibacteria bacterium CG10_big_fil_rev_8_21_14_0_10_36_19]